MHGLVLIEAHGKVEAWTRISGLLGLSLRVVATGGHICRFPDTLNPLGISLEKGKRIDVLRRMTPETRQRILSAVDALPPGCPIIIAMDDDTEGDVIAFDVIELILSERRERSAELQRVRPAAINAEGIRMALQGSRKVTSFVQPLVSASIQGRARAVSDRWIGAAFSKFAGVPVGRVRSALLGTIFLWSAAPHYTRGAAETGEITFQARSGTGGRPWQARVVLAGGPLDGATLRLMEIAKRFSGRMIPGAVRARASLSAAVAPRIGEVKAFNTGDALAYASRHYGIAPTDAMRGLQDAYIRGAISYPRTSSRDIGVETSGRLTQIGAACGLPELDPWHSTRDVKTRPVGEHHAHEGLHPICGIKAAELTQFGEMIRRNITRRTAWEREDVMDLMTVLVSRRALEACRPVTLELGIWRSDNAGSASGLSNEEAEALMDLDWVREAAPAFPWGRDLLTGIRVWPMEAVLVDAMMTEDLGKPSTYAAHVQAAMTSGDLEPGEYGALPRPSPQGMTSLRRTPRTIWNPKTCRTIETALENRGNFLEEDETDSIHNRARSRIFAWLRQMPGEIRETLMAMLEQGSGASGLAGKSSSVSAPGPSAAVEASSGSPFEVSMEMVDPSPFSGG